MNIAGVILAGGLSRRMGGGDKTLKLLAGKPMLAHVIARFAAQVDTLALNANGDDARFAPFGLLVIADRIDGFAGPLAGVDAGLTWAAEEGKGITHIVTVAGDTPFFPRDLVDRLIKANDGADQRIILATSGGNRHPVFGLWPLALANDLATWMARTNTYKVLAFVRRHDHTFADFAITGSHDPFFNANTPEDFAMAETLMANETA